jgi:hypothetical protein
MAYSFYFRCFLFFRPFTVNSGSNCKCGLSLRSSAAPTSGHQARAAGTRYIVCDSQPGVLPSSPG